MSSSRQRSTCSSTRWSRPEESEKRPRSATTWSWSRAPRTRASLRAVLRTCCEGERLGRKSSWKRRRRRRRRRSSGNGGSAGGGGLVSQGRERERKREREVSQGHGRKEKNCGGETLKPFSASCFLLSRRLTPSPSLYLPFLRSKGSFVRLSFERDAKQEQNSNAVESGPRGSEQKQFRFPRRLSQPPSSLFFY